MKPRIPRIVGTFTFRLALVYVGLFSLSVILLFAWIYVFAMNYLQAQVSDSIRQQYAYLRDEYRAAGSSGVEARIHDLIAGDDDGTEIFLLVNREYEKLAGNLNEWPAGAVRESAFEKDGQWVRFHIEGGRGQESLQGIEVKAITIPLSKWRYLLVGASLQSTQKIEQAIVQAFWASLALTLIMAFIGAIVMTRSVMRRINVINRSANAIMRGHLSTRIPFTRGGDEFDELSSNLNRMLDRIEMLLQSLGQFANNIAHDLRSPLNRIINRLDAALMTMHDSNPVRGVLDKNIHDMQELVATFNSILKISELEANAEFRPFETFDLAQIVGNLVELYEPYAAEKRIALSSVINEPVFLRAEKNLITQALSNLLDNALKFTLEQGSVVISCQRGERHIDLLVADDGPGIPQEFRIKVFEKFFRLEESRHTRGNGLGLSLVAAVARIHGAAVLLEDNRPGLRVRFSIPQTE